MTYQLTEIGVKLTNDEGIVKDVPNDPANRDWQAYQEWLALGNEPLEADE